MKKTLALVLAMAVISVFAVVPAFAADTMVFKLGTAEIEAGSGSAEVALDFSVDVTAAAGMTAYGSIQTALILPEGVTFKSAAKATDNTYGWTNETVNAEFIGFSDGSGQGADFLADPTRAKFVLTFVVADISVAKEYEIKFNSSLSAALDYADFSDQPTGYEDGKIVVKAAGPSTTLVKTDSVKEYNCTTVGGVETDTQIGAALGLQFTKPAATLLPKMIWAVQTPAGRRYSNPVAVDLGDVEGTITVAATFLNGTHANEFGAAVVEPVVISEVDGIFTDGTNDYFTNEADKK